MTGKSTFTPSPQVALKLREQAAYGTPHPVAPGVQMVLADNPKDYTGPGTNTYIVGEERVWIIDPGPDDVAHVRAVLKVIGEREVGGIFVTHTHQDHSPAAHHLARITGAKTYGFGALSSDVLAFTDEDVDADFKPDVALACGGVVGDDDWQIMAIHTPGHFPNHLCYALPHKGMLFSGDHVMGWSTTVVVPPLGNLSEYMESLDKLEAGGARLMLPSHGPVVEGAVARIREIREHRQERHRQIAACLSRGIRSPAAIVEEIYEGLTPRLLEAAEGCVRAHLELMEADGEKLLSEAREGMQEQVVHTV
ncbi:MBL fold metallo-hydrolase [Kordiimonas lipolytica]|uniref:MBL fold metallo-hydrolase n=1 Tax=Kordiimonas lipolytica TaxID=1662421 RepID=A0ABV8UEY2_9PROT|nr:MBL fold metallo-hydrolase [Kordiimonas lipolytica]